jgi:hypothetical protein
LKQCLAQARQNFTGLLVIDIKPFCDGSDIPLLLRIIAQQQQRFQLRDRVDLFNNELRDVFRDKRKARGHRNTFSKRTSSASGCSSRKT